MPERKTLAAVLKPWFRNRDAFAGGDAYAAETRLKTAAETFGELRIRLRDPNPGDVAKIAYETLERDATMPHDRLVSDARQVRAVLIEELLGHDFRPVPTEIGDVPLLIDRLIFEPAPESADTRRSWNRKDSRPSKDPVARVDLGRLMTLEKADDHNEKHFIVTLAGRLYLPQYRYWRMLRAVRSSKLVRWSEWALFLFGAILIGLVPGLLPCLGANHLKVLGAAALVGFFCLGAAVFLQPVGLTQLALLRIPATTMLGILAVIGWGKGIVSAKRENEVLIACVVSLLVIGYLALEARMHGANRRRALVGGLIVGVMGLLAATAMMTAALAFVYPVVHDQLHGSVGWGRIMLLGVLSMALGLLVQILWDDKPATSPLSHLDAPIESAGRRTAKKAEGGR